MNIITSSFRQWPIPSKNWLYYQEWNNVLLFHYKVPKEILLPFIPAGLELDTFNGECWVSLVPFTMQKIKFRFLPSWKPISDFHEINVRTYVTRDGKPGVLFLNIEAEKLVSTYVAKLLSGLPYEKASLKRNDGSYESFNKKKNFSLKVQFTVGDKVSKSQVDLWLTERYCLYVSAGKDVYRYEINHEEWEIRKLNVSSLIVNYKIGKMILGNQPELQHYSPGVKVQAWGREKVN